MIRRHWRGGILILLLALLLIAALASPHSYEEQNREAIDAPPSAQFWLGTDSLGRDRWVRLLYGAEISLCLAATAAALSVTVALGAGAWAGFAGGVWELALLSLADLFQCVPWFFLLTAVRGVLPLDVGALLSVAITFLLLGVLGWAGPARLVSLKAREVARSDFVRQALAFGCSRRRIFLKQLAPNLRPVAAAQFWLLLPAYVLAEANLGMLGLGVSEPVPSLGALVKDLESPAVWANWGAVIPLVVLAAVTGYLQIAFRAEMPARSH